MPAWAPVSSPVRPKLPEGQRPARVKVRYRALDGSRREIEADDLLATCLQHEIDHLDGVMFTDRISPLKRNMLIKKFLKEQKLKSREAM